MSTTNIGDVNTQFCATIVDEWVAQGVRHAVIAPGSRSTPLALALVRRQEIATTVVIDERSAAFRAFGIGRVSAAPAVVLCTSGTAAAHFHPAVIEAHHSNVPMIVCTADRPPELRDTGAGQTIDQVGIYGSSPRWFCDPGAPINGQWSFWRSIAARGCVVARGDSVVAAGPVHYNFAFREPLVGNGEPLGTSGPRTFSSRLVAPESAVDTVRDLTVANPRGVIVAGWGCDMSPESLRQLSVATGWPVLADAISNARQGDRTVCYYEALARDGVASKELRPDIVLRVGAPLTSKATNEWLSDAAHQIVVDAHNVWLDPHRRCTLRVAAHGNEFAGALVAKLGSSDRASTEPAVDWFARWRQCDATVNESFERVFAGRRLLDGARVARDVVSALTPGSHMLVASSMPVRDLEWCMAPQQQARIHANRGANGIDGLLATAVGIALASGAPTCAVVGDLAFLHDAGSLLGLEDLCIDLTVVVVDNGGGGIFSFLPQAESTTPQEFELLFGTPQTVRVADVAAAYRVAVTTVDTPQRLRACLLEPGSGIRVIVATTVDRVTEVALHRELWEVSSDALRAVPFDDAR